MFRTLTGTMLAILALGIAATAQPMLEVDAEVYEFGTILEGYAIEHTFVLSNTGDEVLVIDRVRATCGCTTTELATNELRPRESVELKAIVGSSGFGGSTISKSIYVYSNDPRYGLDATGTGGKLTLYIRGSVLRSQPYHMSTEDLYLYSVLLVDVRSASEFATGHFVGALNVPIGELTQTASAFPQGSVIVLYDATGALAEGAVEGMIGNGFPLTRVLSGGLAGWNVAYGTQYLVPEPVGISFGAPITTGAGYSLTASELERVLYVLIDLRSPEDFAAGHLFGAINIPAAGFSAANVEQWVGDIPSDTEIIAYDQSGLQSDAVAQALIAAGYANSKSLLGGLDEWARVYGDQLIWADAQ